MTILERNSSFELLRLIAQYMIVVYHIILFWFVHTGTNPIHVYKAICIPLHIGVILYVLVSGYFGIRFSLKGVTRIIANLFIYGLLLSIIGHYWIGDEFNLKELFFVSNSPFWFVRTYLMLYLVAPLVNKIIRGMSTNNRLLLLLLLLWASCYVGMLGFDNSLIGGTNLMHFILIYLIGNTLALYKEKINEIPIFWILLSYALINALSIGGYLFCVGTRLEGISYAFAFKYNSILLITNAICFFVPFMRMNFTNGTINFFASSCFAVYLIHSASLVLNHPIKDAALFIQTHADNVIILFMVCGLALVILFDSILIDKVLMPYWKLVDMIVKRLNNTKLGKVATIWSNQ